MATNPRTMMTHTNSRRALLPAFFFVGLAAVAATAQDPRPLLVSEAQAGSLVTADAQAYTLDLEAGQFVFGEADQVSVDVVVTILDGDGERVARFDGPGRGPEPFQFETKSAGQYRIEIAPFEEERGEYRIVLRRVEPVASDPGRRVDQLMASYARADVPGGVVAVVRGGELAFARAYGAANLTHDIPFGVETRTNIGSTSKQFTAMAIMLLAERGELSLDDDVRKHIPELPDFGETVTLRHFLTHTSGYREFLNLVAMGGRRLDQGDYIDRAELIEIVQRQPALQNSPGSEFNYNNTGFGLLATVVERISGESFADWMAANVFGPLDMKDTFVRPHAAHIIPGSAMGYTPEESGGYRNAADLSGATGAGGIYTTVGDLAKWVRNYRTAELGTPEIIEQMSTPFTLSTGRSTGYGFGLFVDEYRGQKRIHHGGADTAHRSMVMYFPELDTGIITQSNNSGFAGTIANSVADAFLDDHLTSEGEATDDAAGETDVADAAFDPATFVRESFDALAGSYELEEQAGFVLTFTRDEEKFFIQATGQPRIEMVPTSASTFRLVPVDAQITFHADEDGAVTSLTLHQNGEHPAKRVTEEAWAPGTEDLAAYTGRYFSEELETFYDIVLEDDTLTLRHRRFDDVALSPAQEHEFTGGFPVAQAVFQSDGAGRITSLEVSNGRTRGVRFVRVE